MPHVFYVMLHTIWTCENCTQLHYNVAEGTVIVQCGSSLCRQFSSTFKAQHGILQGLTLS